MTLGLVGFATLLYSLLSFFLARKNRLRKEGKEEGKTERMTDEEIEELGDESPRFLYTI